MYPERKIKKRGKFKAPSCDSPACSAHKVDDADPTTAYLDVIPEARALYKGRGPKRKVENENETCDNVDNSWKRYRERRQISLPLNDEEDEDSESEEEESEEDIIKKNFRMSITRKPRRKRRLPTYMETTDLIDELMKGFRLQDQTYEDIMTILEEEMDKGLKLETHHESTVRMFPTYVRAIPDGSERGRFLALDLGGTNFRVLLVDLRGCEQPHVISRLYLIPKRIMLGSGTMLFDHIAKCLAEFIEAEGLKSVKLPMGFTFSFPCYQDGLAAARLVRWTKGFRCEGVQDNDVVRMLHDAIKRRNDIDVECVAIINDPVGALMTEAHADKNCLVGVILGTGTNCCYMERLDRVQIWDEDREDPKQVIVNTEWGAFGDSGILEFIRNDFDRQLDNNSLNPGHQLFEKMISGMYMGEIVRLVLCQLCADGLLFGGEGSEELFEPNIFLTKYISEIESDDPNGTFSSTKLVLQELDIPHFTVDDCRHVQQVCWQVSQRAAFLAATAVATVINRLNRPDVTVAVDGSLYRFHPHFHDLMMKKIAQLIKPHHKFRLALAHDGSGKGAALVAAVADRMRKNSQSSTTTTVTNVDNNNTTVNTQTLDNRTSASVLIEQMDH